MPALQSRNDHNKYQVLSMCPLWILLNILLALIIKTFWENRVKAKAECSPEMAISLVMLYHKTKFVILIYHIPCRMQIWWHMAEYHINFYQDPVGNFIEVYSEGSCKPALAVCQLQPERLGRCRGKPGWRNPDGFEGMQEVSGSLIQPGQYILMTKSTEKNLPFEWS